MKTKSTKLNSYLFLLASVCLITINSCKKDNETLPDIKMQEVKAYVSSNLNKSESNIFSKLDVDWSNATANELQNEIVQEIRLKNPDRIIQTSVVTDKPENFENRNDIRLIVFKNKETDKVTNAVYMSVINDGELMDLTKIQYKKSNNLTGKILFYGLDGQFLNGWHYTKGKIDQSITPSTEKAYKANIARTLQTSPGKLSSIKNENKTALALVMVCSEDMVPSYGISCVGVEGYMRCEPYFQGYTYVEYCQYENGGGSGDGGGVTTPPTGGSGSNSGSANSAYNPQEFQFVTDPAISLLDLLTCFGAISSNGATYSITLSADLPVNSDPMKLVDYSKFPPSPGHAFITLTKTNGSTSVTKSFGFYPSIQVLSLTAGPVGSKMNDNGGHEYDSRISMGLTEGEFQLAITEALNKQNMSYDINSYNCTDYALDVFNSVRTVNNKLEVPNWIGSSGFNYGRTPNGLYNKLSQLQSYGNNSVSMANGNATAKSGSCN